jgi:hypothetical protein
VWTSRGLQTDGWTHPGRLATIRVYGARNANAELVYVRISLQGPTGASAQYRLSSEGEEHVDSLAPSAVSQEEVSLCIGGGSPADVTILSRSSASVEGPPLGPDAGPTRRVGVGVTSVFVLPTRRACKLLAVLKEQYCETATNVLGMQVDLVSAGTYCDGVSALSRGRDQLRLIQHVCFRRHDEVVAMDATDLVPPPGDGRPVPLGRQAAPRISELPAASITTRVMVRSLFAVVRP